MLACFVFKPSSPCCLTLAQTVMPAEVDSTLRKVRTCVGPVLARLASGQRPMPWHGCDCHAPVYVRLQTSTLTPAPHLTSPTPTLQPHRISQDMPVTDKARELAGRAGDRTKEAVRGTGIALDPSGAQQNVY